MNIKTKQTSLIIALVGLMLALAVNLSFILPTASAQNADNRDTDPVLALCEKNAKKARSECKDATDQVRDGATHKCTKAKVKASCVRDKALVYMKKASAGNPDTAKFKSQLDKTLDDAKISDAQRNSPASGFGAKAGDKSSQTTSFFGTTPDNDKEGYTCGGSETDQVVTRFNFGCLGNTGPEENGPILDLVFSFIRFLSAGVGIIIVGSIILAGIQYSASEGKPDATQAAKNRIQDAFIGLIIYIFAFSIVQFLVPGGLFT